MAVNEVGRPEGQAGIGHKREVCRQEVLRGRAIKAVRAALASALRLYAERSPAVFAELAVYVVKARGGLGVSIFELHAFGVTSRPVGPELVFGKFLRGVEDHLAHVPVEFAVPLRRSKSFYIELFKQHELNVALIYKQIRHIFPFSRIGMAVHKGDREWRRFFGPYILPHNKNGRGARPVSSTVESLGGADGCAGSHSAQTRQPWTPIEKSG